MLEVTKCTERRRERREKNLPIDIRSFFFISQKMEENGETAKNDIFHDLTAGIWVENIEQVENEEDD